MRRRPAAEARLGGVLRALAPHSSSLADELREAFAVLVTRGSFERPLYAALARAVGERSDPRSTTSLEQALLERESPHFATLSGACLSRDPGLSQALAQVARSRHAHLAFAAEVARSARGESAGSQARTLVAKIKEAHRIALCQELCVPLSWSKPLHAAALPALAALRESERHLGRWLVLGELATRAGDPAPLAEAVQQARTGPASSRGAWSMVTWALTPTAEPPTARLSSELVARLSDRPSADRDATFLFRVARAGTDGARPLLAGLAKPPLRDESGVRAALHLARDYDDAHSLETLTVAARGARGEAVRGLCAAALFDAGRPELALEAAQPLLASRHLPSLAWGALITASHAGPPAELVTEPNVRRLQFGWSE